MLLQELEKRKLIHPPRWLADNCIYLTYMGSVAYGVSSDTSDCDVYGICIPKKVMVFPHLDGQILGFGNQQEVFNQWQEHHIVDVDAAAGKGKEYDFSVYSIVRYFQLCMENNPNIVDSIFTPLNCVIHISRIGNIIRENRRLFLHKGCYHKFLGYAHSQLSKIQNKKHVGLDDVLVFEEEHGIPNTTKLVDVQIEMKRRSMKQAINFTQLNDEALEKYHKLFSLMNSNSKRAENVKVEGFDLKFSYHLVRLADEAEQILTLGDLDLTRAAEHMKAVRRGEVSEEDLRNWFSERERTLERLYSESKLQHTPPQEKIKALLLNCLEEHYGSLENCITTVDSSLEALKSIRKILDNLNM